MLKDYWKYLQGNEQNMEKFFTAVVDAIEDMKDKDKYAYAKSYFTVHESIFGKHFSEELVKYAVSCMENVDGTQGEHWTLQQTTSLATSQGINVNRFDFYYTMNMLYSDFYEVLGSDASSYLKMAKAYLEDPDATKDKAYCMWKARFFV